MGRGGGGRDWISFHAGGRAILVLHKASPLPLKAFGLRLQSLRVGFSYRGTPAEARPARSTPDNYRGGEEAGKRSYWPNLASAWPGVSRDSKRIPSPAARPVPGHTGGPGVTPAGIQPSQRASRFIVATMVARGR